MTTSSSTAGAGAGPVLGAGPSGRVRRVDHLQTARSEQPARESTNAQRPRLRPLERLDGARRASSAIPLLEMEPDLHRLLPPKERAAAQRFLLPVATVESNEDLSALLAESAAFGALVLDGLLLQTLQISGRKTLRMIGPGALVPVEPEVDWMPLARSEVRAADRTRLVVLGKAFLVAAQRWPSVVVCLHERMLEHAARLTRQLAISQLPRVEERVVAMLALLAETWGTVTPAGIRVNLALTQGTLGGLIGARRPTVSLALKALAERSAVKRCDGGWLLAAQ